MSPRSYTFTSSRTRDNMLCTYSSKCTVPTILAGTPEATLKVPWYGDTCSPWALATADDIRDRPAPVSSMTLPLLGDVPPKMPASIVGYGSSTVAAISALASGSSSILLPGVRVSHNTALCSDITELMYHRSASRASGRDFSPKPGPSQTA